MSGQPTGPDDTMTCEGARALAARLDAYWHKEGYPKAQHWIEPAHYNGKGKGKSKSVPKDVQGWHFYVVRSNLHNGIPPR